MSRQELCYDVFSWKLVLICSASREGSIIAAEVVAV